MKYNFDAAIERRGSRCEKYDNLNKVFGREDIIPAWVADMDFATPDFIMEAIKERMKHPILAYSFRDDSYYNSIANYLHRRNGWRVERDWLDFTPGVVCGISYAINILTNEGDGVVIQPPVYPPFARTIKANHRKVVENTLVWDGEKYQIDFEDLDKKMAEAKMIILCNPHNPTSKVYSYEELKKIGELALKNNIKIVSDEIHSDIVLFGNKHTHIASISKEIADITITYTAASKTFNIAGLSTSVAIIPGKELMDIYRSNGDMLHVDQGNIFGAIALEAAYNKGEEWLDQLLAYLEGNAKYIVDFVAANMPKIKCQLPDSTFLIWLDCREMGLTHDELKDFFLNKAKVGLNSGVDFGTQGDCFMRLNSGTTLDNIKKIMENILTAYSNEGF